MTFLIKNKAGQSLKYEVNEDCNTVTVYKDDDNKPEGLLVIPASITYEGKTYSITSIGYAAFKDCEKLTSIIIPNTVTSIDHLAFCDCISLAAFNIPDSVISIEDWVFENTAWENNLSDGIMYKDGWCLGYKGNKPSGTLSIQEGTKGIGRAAFQDCTALTSVTLPHTTIVIGELAFAGCAGLATITIPDSVTTIDWRAFEKSTGLTSISLSNSLMSIEDGVFDGCTALTSIAIPKSVTSIGEGAFSGCSSLTAVTIPNTVSVIKRAAFEDCIKLADFTIPDSVTELAQNAFDNTAWRNNQPNGVLYKDGWYLGWNGLNLSEEICIEEGTKGIAKPAFLPEDATIVICKALTPPAIKRDIYGVEKDITIYVPAESLEAYQNADGWKKYNIQPIKEEIGFIIKNEAGQTLKYEVNDDNKTVTVYKDEDNEPEGLLVIPESVTYEGGNIHGNKHWRRGI